MKKTIDSYAELQVFLAPLLAEDKWFIDIRRIKGTESYTVEWQEHKTYVAHGDGKEYRDEVWITEQNVPYFIQDLTPEHCRNVLRMILRQDRERDQMLKQLADALGGEGDMVLPGLEDEVDNLFPASTKPGSSSLH